MSKTDKKIQRLIDADEIRRLVHRYAKCVDHHLPPEKIVDLFTDDAKWSAPRGFGAHEGREQLLAVFGSMPDNVIFSVHAFGNEDIDIDGDKATGSWVTIIPYTMREEFSTADHWAFLRYDCKFVRKKDKWRIKEMHLVRLADGPHRLGWIDSV